MHILIAANTAWYLNNFRGRLITALIEEGHRVTALAPQDDYAPRLAAKGARYLPLPFCNTGTGPSEAATLLRMGRLLRAERPDLVLTYTPKINIYLSLAARALGIPVLANISGMGRGFISGGLLKAVMLLLYRVALRHPSKVFFQNEDDLEEFTKLKLVDPCRTALLPGSGVDLGRFRPAARPRREETVFLMVARLLTDKGAREYVAAARELKKSYPQVRFQLLGPLQPPAPSAISAAELDTWRAEGVVEYLGSTDDVLPFYHAADCLVLPSYREGTPRTLLEGAATALPLVATDAVGCRNAVKDGVNGFLCRMKDAADLAATMRRFLELPHAERERLGAAGRKRMELSFDEEIVITRYLKEIKRIEAGMA
ncbi:glycosyltransferase family 4 protein [Geomonas subterranea]|uniref:Glycosyltransferase family 4 protein n=1 Tax=Geomonas subterranea TaxID=2847989 RepID=A0ABX8LHV7_9BACT|nr:glycosyltransferase family 4 protein [Geomonas subterranea]QXE91552.1 glycosyltransferase family 4 protein [Geomonas subterranea]QXM10359.1 glycosyltransferase family 4 protein [Geomonas subterranea]